MNTMTELSNNYHAFYLAVLALQAILSLAPNMFLFRHNWAPTRVFLNFTGLAFLFMAGWFSKFSFPQFIYVCLFASSTYIAAMEVFRSETAEWVEDYMQMDTGKRILMLAVYNVTSVSILLALLAWGGFFR